MSTAAIKQSKLRSRVGGTLLAALIIGVLLFTVFPTKTFLDQRRRTQIAREELSLLRNENSKLDQRSKTLESDSEIERIAREDYNLVRPGEEAYSFLPSEPKKKAAKAKAKEEHQNWFEKTTDKLSFWN